MKRDLVNKILVGCWLLGLSLLLGPLDRAAAHGGGVPRLTNEPLGPYWVSVWTQPDPLRTGAVHVTVALAEPGDPTAATPQAGPPILNAEVALRWQPLGWPGESYSVRATHQNAVNKFLYEADLEVEQAGLWEVILLVDGPDGGSGQARFEADVLPAAGSALNWSLIGLGGMAALVAFVIARNLGLFHRPDPANSSPGKSDRV